jgi:hypothetical protein
MSVRAGRLGGALIVALMTGCTDESGWEPSCDYQESGDLAEGYWQLEATGTRSGCANRRFNGALRIEASRSVAVHAMAEETSGPVTGPDAGVSEADAFIRRIERADYRLSASALPSALVFDEGATAGSCVSFRLTETLEDGDRLRYVFDGSFDGPDRIRGTFTGDGPGACDTQGTFTVRLE